MPRVRPKQTPNSKNYLQLWESEYKPQILQYYSPPIELVAEILGISVNTVQEQLRSGLYDYGVARPCAGGTYRYEFMPLRLISYIEGRMSKTNMISYE